MLRGAQCGMPDDAADEKQNLDALYNGDIEDEDRLCYVGDRDEED